MSTPKKVALVTGAARGIGLGIAKCLAADGCHLVVNATRDEQAVASVLAELRQRGAEVLYCQADVSDAQARAAMLAQVRQHFGRLDVLVNNAGVAPKVRADLLEATEASFERLVRINLQGPYFLTQAAASWMVEQQTADGLSRLHRQDFVDFGHGGLAQSRGVLHLEGGHQHGHAGSGRPGWESSTSRFTRSDPAWSRPT